MKIPRGMGLEDFDRDEQDGYGEAGLQAGEHVVLEMDRAEHGGGGGEFPRDGAQPDPALLHAELCDEHHEKSDRHPPCEVSKHGRHAEKKRSGIPEQWLARNRLFFDCDAHAWRASARRHL